MYQKFVCAILFWFTLLTSAAAQTAPVRAERPGAVSAIADIDPPVPELSAETVTVDGKVVAVSDGDTLTLLDGLDRQHKIRLAGIDAPEKFQDFGIRAKQNLSDLVFGKTVRVFVGKTDKYGRLVGTVYLDGKNVNFALLKAGFAWHYKQYENEQPPAERQAFAAAEAKARQVKSGLWANADPTPPWEFRRNGRAIKDDELDAAATSGNESASGTSRKAAVRQSDNGGSNSSSGGRTYFRGPHGGCYYINSNGNKTYVPRSLCN